METMQKATHTPGPWKVTEAKVTDGEVCFHEIRGSDGAALASTWAGPHEGNARLIATAPQLLEVLIECGNALIDALPSGHPDFAIVQKARAAIAAAGGAT